MKCIFCNNIEENQILTSTDNFIVVYDIAPLQKGHLLIISKEHYENIYEIPQLVLTELILLEQHLIKTIEKGYEVLGVSVIQNNGLVMDEGTHFHVHIVPRYEDDCFWGNQVITQHEIPLEKLSYDLNTLDFSNNVNMKK